MKKHTLNIFLFILTTFVVFLSIGPSISKMQCSKNGEFFFGTEVPNCMQIEEISCSEDSKELSCCEKKNLLQTCCPQTNDDSCASETANFQFDFETPCSYFVIDFKEFCTLVFQSLFYEKSYSLQHQRIFIRDVPFPPNLHKPELTQIQSFLL
jgi:hypothetical protein